MVSESSQDGSILKVMFMVNILPVIELLTALVGCNSTRCESPVPIGEPPLSGSNQVAALSPPTTSRRADVAEEEKMSKVVSIVCQRWLGVKMRASVCMFIFTNSTLEEVFKPSMVKWIPPGVSDVIGSGILCTPPAADKP